MISKVFVFILDCLKQIVNIFRNFYLDPGFSYFDFMVCCSVVFLLFRLLRTIRDENEADSRWLQNRQRYDEQKVRDKLRTMDERDGK